MVSDTLDSFLIIGGGFAGLSAAFELTKAGQKVTVLEADAGVGGLASAFEVEGGERLDRFYHHWFTNDLEVMGLIDDLGMRDHVVEHPTNTGLYFANTIFKLSTPMDLLKFKPLPFLDRIRLGLLALRARRVKSWMDLEHRTAAEWLTSLGGKNVYRVVWEPLMSGKFGPYADKISAVWMWNKLKLRGGSRGKGGEERLCYFSGGFVKLAEETARQVAAQGGEIRLNAAVESLTQGPDGWTARGAWGEVTADRVIATPALPQVADMIRDTADADYVASLDRIDYLANVCLVLQLDRSLSSTYWLNVNDPSFPYVAVIEHTNFEKAETYGGNHIVYLSKYLPHTDDLYRMSDEEVLEFSIPHLQKMFPAFSPDWIRKSNVWRARWSQPVVEQHYSKLIPHEDAPLEGLHLCSMAQIYPEDRGTNYAVREGRRIGKRLAGSQSGQNSRINIAAQ
ncbi:Protoporphyrinogen oxidase [Candidatus Rhodobacter oscarellae]|uniref:Protoporphyrinogen oxidase n=1 Tax=Candidatus Rhodobacter oscarellae TaxID=1675527 RepID=A0A0J9EDC8_9RHOB|nr:NAD(P)/FAD-dependent oxidoreductase [Candidatus Rhodobacter lobularis]KMW59729.1 Protoporphyrinogen oxidase [Candidatus Rhodobacter lobularis]